MVIVRIKCIKHLEWYLAHSKYSISVSSFSSCLWPHVSPRSLSSLCSRYVGFFCFYWHHPLSTGPSHVLFLLGLYFFVFSYSLPMQPSDHNASIILGGREASWSSLTGLVISAILYLCMMIIICLFHKTVGSINKSRNCVYFCELCNSSI